MGKKLKKPIDTFVDDLNDYVVIPPDGGWGWVVVTSAFMSTCVADAIVNTFGLFVEEIAADLNVKTSLLTLASALLTGLYFLFGPVVCALTNKYGFRAIAFIGGIVATGGLIWASYIEDYMVFIPAYGITLGLGFSMIYISNILCVGFYFDRLRAIATSIAVSGSAVGTMSAPPIFNILLKDYTWREKFWVLAGCTVFLTLLSFIYKPITPSKIVIEDGGHKAPQPVTEDETTKNIYYKKVYPTNADIVARSSYVIQPSRLSEVARMSETNVGGGSKTSFKSFKSYRARHSIYSFVSRRMSTIPEGNLLLTRKTFSEKLTDYCICCMPKHVHRPMYRDDILYQGSISALPQFKTQPNVNKLFSIVVDVKPS